MNRDGYVLRSFRANVLNNRREQLHDAFVQIEHQNVTSSKIC